MHSPPLSLYIHIPWCVQKCPYCDFNSHGVKSAIPEKEYIAHLLDDLTIDSKLVSERPISSIFIGGGTPSLFSESGIATLLSGVKSRVCVNDDAEITLEANPGTLESGRFKGFKQAGVNRLSIGVQSFQPQHLTALGRIHDTQQAHQAIVQAKEAGMATFNIDLMHGLPGQSLDNALDDLQHALDHHPVHLSWYQLTIEPNTAFASKPPTLPDDDVLWDIQQHGHQKMHAAGLVQYEISAYARPGHECQHNLNYWRFGDYLGIGCGAHGKITQPHLGTITRTVKVKHPRGYMQLGREYTDNATIIDKEDMAFEFFMNRFRLLEACPKSDFEALTGAELSAQHLSALSRASDLGLLEDTPSSWRVTDHGRRYLNSLLESFV